MHVKDEFVLLDISVLESAEFIDEPFKVNVDCSLLEADFELVYSGLSVPFGYCVFPRINSGS